MLTPLLYTITGIIEKTTYDFNGTKLKNKLKKSVPAKEDTV